LSGIEEISEYVNQLSFDLKAEMLAAVLAEKKIDPSEILAVFNGQFRRNWSRDIERSNVENLETGEEMLCLHLNRDGVYDSLPELLFHKNLETDNQSAAEMAKDSMRLKAEEKESRSFFQPFENEIFFLGVQLAMKENQLFKNIYTEFLTGIIPDFWRVDSNLPEKYIVRLKKLLPLVYRITGDLALTAQCLEFIIKESVKISTATEKADGIQEGEFNHSGILGQCLLGVDTVFGNMVNGFVNRLIFSIGPIVNPEANEFVKNGTMDRFLDCFYSYFIPFELDVETKYIFDSEQSLFMLDNNTDTQISYLGYNSVIQ
jgi:hypothetical protein